MFIIFWNFWTHGCFGLSGGLYLFRLGPSYDIHICMHGQCVLIVNYIHCFVYSFLFYISSLGREFKFPMTIYLQAYFTSITVDIYRTFTLWYLTVRLFVAMCSVIFVCLWRLLTMSHCNRFGFSVRRLSLSCFEIPEVIVKDTITAIAHMWNSGFYCVRSLAQGQDWKILFQVWTV